MANLRILAIPSSSYIFGTENMTLAMFEHISRCNESHFLISRWSDGEFARRLDELGLPYTYTWMGTISRRLTPEALRWTLNCLSRLPILYRDYLALLWRFRPDVVYVSTYKQLLLLWPMLALTGAPRVCHIADPPVIIPFQRAVSPVWRSVVDLYVPISQSVVDRLQTFGVGPRRIALVYPGIAIEEFPYAERRDEAFTERFGWPQDAVIVGITGQMIEDKGHLDLLEAAQLARRHVPQLRLVIGGKPREPYISQLRQRAEELGLGDSVAFSGWQEHPRDFYRAVDILALPSRHDEGFGLVVAEAMATGRPVVVTASGGASEVAEHGVTGFVVEKRRPDQLARALCFLAGSPEARRALGAAGRRRAEARFTLERQAAALDAALTRAAAERKR